MSLTIGVDYGGVLSIHADGYSAGEHKSDALNMPGGYEALLRLKSQGHKLYLISFCGQARAITTHQTISNLPNKELFDGIYFVKSKQFKKDICAYLGCDVMIDDRIDILTDIAKSIPKIDLLWFQGDPGFEKAVGQRTRLRNIHEIGSWTAALAKIATLKSHQNSPNETIPLVTKIHSTT